MSDDSSSGRNFPLPFCFSSFFSGLSASAFFFLRGIPASHLRFLPVGVRSVCGTGVVLLLDDLLVLEGVETGPEEEFFRGLVLTVVLLLAVLVVEFLRGRFLTP